MAAKANPGGQAEFRPTFPGQHESEAVKLVFGNAKRADFRLAGYCAG
jgi:hypothetical protein